MFKDQDFQFWDVFWAFLGIVSRVGGISMFWAPTLGTLWGSGRLWKSWIM